MLTDYEQKSGVLNPFLNREAILACISYGAASVRNEILIDVE